MKHVDMEFILCAVTKYFIELLKCIMALIQLKHELREMLKKKVLMMRLTPEQWREYHHTRTCHICKNDTKNDEKKVREQDHLTGQSRRAARSICNLHACNYFPVN